MLAYRVKKDCNELREGTVMRADLRKASPSCHVIPSGLANWLGKVLEKTQGRCETSCCAMRGPAVQTLDHAPDLWTLDHVPERFWRRGRVQQGEETLDHCVVRLL